MDIFRNYTLKKNPLIKKILISKADQDKLFLVLLFLNHGNGTIQKNIMLIFLSFSCFQSPSTSCL